LTFNALYGVISQKRELFGLRVFENRLLRRILKCMREEGIGWRKLHSEELHN
jgi:hypothetical protein